MLRAIALGLAGVIMAGAGLASPVHAQFRPYGNPQVYGGFGAEDGYNDDEFGWGPAYRPDTTFRPAYGFYGGVERPYPYGGGAYRGPAPAYGYEDEPVYAPPRRSVRQRRATSRQVHPQRRIVTRTEARDPGVWR